jgi:drug/metabolite transporter (DMT)-like permease
VTRAYAPLITVLALLWGASYLFIKVGIRGFEPTTMMLIRLVVASTILVGFLHARGELRALRAAPKGAYLLGLANAAVPFTLIAWGEKHVDSGTAAVASSGVPLFVALIALRFTRGERATRLQLVGLLLGFAGVAWLVGLHPDGGWWYAAGTLANVGGALSYAIGSLYGQHLVARVSGPVLAATAYLGAAAALLPFGIVQAPHAWPGWGPVAAVLALAVLGTALAQLLWFRLLARYGSGRSTLVSYLLPAVALVYGSVFLSEPLSLAKLGGFALILGGVVLASWRGSRPAGRALRPARADDLA